ncbi:hypothetical protein FACS189447_07810 [Spirochaetia bacterium]|nr:hypothetical protein FACS189447_07810 [Spirochaetia bacterium]
MNQIEKKIRATAARRGILLDSENPFSVLGGYNGQLNVMLNPLPEAVKIEFKLEAGKGGPEE